MSNKQKKYAVSALIIVCIILVISNFIRIRTLSNENENLEGRLTILEGKFASTTEDLRGTISKSHQDLSDALNKEKQNVGTLEQKLGTYRQEIGDVSSSVNNLQKLSQIDPQLLSKYSKVFFLNENYAPERLVEIPADYRYSDGKVLKINDKVWPFLKKMMDTARDNGISFYTFSAYRSFNEQQALKGQYTVSYGAGTANQFSADQGYSEHQLGTTLDFIAPGLNGNLDGFETTKAYQWLHNNAHRYGFILSYPKNNKFYVYEPWHWRFVGVKLATFLYNQDKHFYDMDQRDIDEYLISLFD